MMNNMEKFNGWKNYETWLTYTWLYNDSELVDTMKEYHECSSNVISFPELMKNYFFNWVQDLFPNACFFSDALESFLSDVDFDEIAVALYEEAEKEKKNV